MRGQHVEEYYILLYIVWIVYIYKYIYFLCILILWNSRHNKKPLELNMIFIIKRVYIVYFECYVNLYVYMYICIYVHFIVYKDGLILNIVYMIVYTNLEKKNQIVWCKKEKGKMKSLK